MWLMNQPKHDEKGLTNEVLHEGRIRHMTGYPLITAVVLAGGLASRMGGGDKGLRMIAGVPILTRVIDRVRPQVDHTVINANGDAKRFASYGLRVVADDLPDRPGPLAGIVAGMDDAANNAALGYVLSVAADCPFLPADLASRLSEALKQQNARIAVAHSGGFAQPTIALWDIGLRHDLRKALVEEELRKIDRFTARYRVAAVEWPVEPFDPFFNANAPDDLALAETIVARYRDA
jgi:molybdenum cofactor guanylyltransferase